MLELRRRSSAPSAKPAVLAGERRRPCRRSRPRAASAVAEVGDDELAVARATMPYGVRIARARAVAVGMPAEVPRAGERRDRAGRADHQAGSTWWRSSATASRPFGSRDHAARAADAADDDRRGARARCRPATASRTSGCDRPMHVVVGRHVQRAVGARTRGRTGGRSRSARSRCVTLPAASIDADLAVVEVGDVDACRRGRTRRSPGSANRAMSRDRRRVLAGFGRAGERATRRW